MLITGCASIETPLDDGYQPGDVGRTVYGGAGRILQLQHEYCQNGDLLAREMLLYFVRSAVPGYPVDGLCTDLIAVIREASDKRANDDAS